MNRAIKAALLSALVFPGSGHLYLKYRRRGLAIMFLTVLSLVGLVVRAARDMLTALQTSQIEGKNLDLDALLQVASSISHKAFANYGLLVILLVGCWLFSVIDAYRIGKQGRA